MPTASQPRLERPPTGPMDLADIDALEVCDE